MPAAHHFLAPEEGALPPAEVHFTELRAEPWPDGRRVRLHITMTPFQQSPNLEAILCDQSGNEISRALIVENIDDQIVFTLHIRTPQPQGSYTILAQLSYPEIGVVSESRTTFIIPELSGGDA